jgi:hypothetical protein
MTISVNRVEKVPDLIVVRFTYGSVEATCREHFLHVKSVWSQLGHLIEQCEADVAAAQKAEDDALVQP